MKPEVMRALIAAGATAEMLVAAIEAEQQEAERIQADRKAKAAARQKAKRERDKLASDADCHAMSRDVTQSHGDNANVTPVTRTTPPSPSNGSPTPPPITTPSTPSASLRSAGARGARLPDDWEPSAETFRTCCEALGSAPAVNAQLLRFRDYWRAQPGQKGVKLDWDATFRNWCRRAAETTGPPRGQVQPFTRRDIRENKTDAAISKLENFNRSRLGGGEAGQGLSGDQCDRSGGFLGVADRASVQVSAMGFGAGDECDQRPAGEVQILPPDRGDQGRIGQVGGRRS